MNNVLAKITKLLQMQEGRGATEAEAQIAAAHVQRLLQEHNLTLSQVEAHAGTDSQSTREKKATDNRALYVWQRSLMRALAENNFCLHIISKVRNEKALYSGGRGITSRVHVLVGRTINVDATVMTYNYLVEAMSRAATDAGFTRTVMQDVNTFLEGAVERLVERLGDLRRQREAEAATPAPAGNGTHRELVLTDVYGSEADLNNDALNNFAPGTTAARRREAAERAKRRQEEQARLVAEGIGETEAWYRAYGYSAEQAAEAARTDARRNARSGRGRTRDWTQADERQYAKRSSAAFKAGRAAGNSIGLDAQVGASAQRRIGR